ncbi:RecB family exonuclease [Raineyella fluvialis]|uniref:RecB family exonuclease n=1 Tax=Raineyella fluvialis TaxID=2662261 RepID=UPI001890958D|nr:PD-(D/E)XK nuclease family protein [Raineyella fluvialis]
MGTLIHELARRASAGEVGPEGLRAAFDEAWAALPAGPAWRQDARRERAWSMVQAWSGWDADRPRDQLVGVEVPFRCDLTVELPDGRPETVTLRGVVDRLELVDDTLVVVDYKTGRKATAGQVQTLGQLGVYQLAVRAGAFDELIGAAVHRPGKALAVYLDAGEGAARAATLVQPSLDDVPVPDGIDVGSAPDWASAAVAEAARIVRDEDFVARRGSHCRGCPFATDCPPRGARR